MEARSNNIRAAITIMERAYGAAFTVEQALGRKFTTGRATTARAALDRLGSIDITTHNLAEWVGDDAAQLCQSIPKLYGPLIDKWEDEALANQP